MAIDIAYYISQIELQMDATIKRSESRLKEKGRVLEEDRLNILLRGAMMIVKGLEEEIYHEVKEREYKSYDYCSNEMNLLALATLLWAWSSWVFKSKSDDKNRSIESREQAAAVNKYIESLIKNAITAGQRIGEGGERPAGRSKLITIT